MWSATGSERTSSVLRTHAERESADFEGWSLRECTEKAFAYRAHESGYQTQDSQRLLAQLLIAKTVGAIRSGLSSTSRQGYSCLKLERLSNIATQPEKEAVLASADAKPPTDETVSKETDDALKACGSVAAKRQTKVSVAYYKRVIEQFSSPVDAYIGLGWCLFDLNHP